MNFGDLNQHLILALEELEDRKFDSFDMGIAKTIGFITGVIAVLIAAGLYALIVELGTRP